MSRVKGFIKYRLTRIVLMISSSILVGYALLSIFGLLDKNLTSKIMDFSSAFLLYILIVFRFDDYLYKPLHDRWLRLRAWMNSPRPSQNRQINHQEQQIQTEHYQHDQEEAIRYMLSADTYQERQAVIDFMIDCDLFVKAKLRHVNLAGAYLIGANLAYANLENSDLSGVNLTGANLAKANLCRANLSDAKLTLANLFETGLNGAILPDGTQWTHGRDMSRFTDPDHPDFCYNNLDDEVIANA